MTGVIALAQAHDDAQAGGKAAGLARLLDGGFAVPDGVVLSADLLAAWEPSRPAPDAVVTAVQAATAHLGDGAFAVRSSAVGEDGTDASYAGVFESVLDVPADRVIDAVRRCLAAARSARVDEYAGGRKVAMAVILQRMLAPTAAGVAFSADPVTGDRDLVRVSAVAGVADRLVAGEVDGDEWVVGPSGVERLTGDGAIDALTAQRLADEVRRVEALWGRPVDVEWALTGDEVWLVQARPITVLPTPTAETLPGTGWEKDVSHNPEPITPFGTSTYMDVFDIAARHMCDTYGLLVKTVENRVVGGEVYIRVVPAVGPADTKGRSAPPAALLGLLARVVPSLRRRVHLAQEVVAAGRLTGVFDDWDRTWRDELVTRADRLLDVDLGALDDESLVGHLQECRRHFERGGKIHMELFLPYAVALHELVEFCRDRLGWDEAKTIALLAGHSRASTAGRDDLADVAVALDGRADVLAALREGAVDPVGALRPVAPEVADRLAAWFRTHAWRTVNYDPGSPALAERPALVTSLLLDGVTAADDGSQTRVQAEQTARDALGEDDLAEFERLLAAARRAYPNREENIVHCDNIPCGLLRRWLGEAARRLVARGLLGRVDDGPWLTADELVAGLRGATSGQNLRGAVDRRRSEYAWTRAHPGPVHVGEPDASPDVSKLPDAARRLNGALLWMVGQEYPPERDVDASDALAVGAPGSPGTHTGPAKVVLTERDFGKVRPGDVMVCPVTTPAWTLLFATAGALVTDAGGVLSHAAIVAREHGIPAVLGTGDLTSKVNDGDLLTVDGTAGTVHRTLDPM